MTTTQARNFSTANRTLETQTIGQTSITISEWSWPADSDKPRSTWRVDILTPTGKEGGEFNYMPDAWDSYEKCVKVAQ